MIKVIKYFFEAIIIYFFLIIGKLIGLYKARKFFSFISPSLRITTVGTPIT